MANAFLTGLEDVGKVLAWPFVHGARVIAILTATLKDYPAVRTAVTGLVQQCITVESDAASAIKDGGLNLDEDAISLDAAKALYAYVTGTFLPAIEAAYNDEVTAATGQAATAAAAAAKASAAAKKAAATRAATKPTPDPTAKTSGAGSGSTPTPPAPAASE